MQHLRASPPRSKEHSVLVAEESGWFLRQESTNVVLAAVSVVVVVATRPPGLFCVRAPAVVPRVDLVLWRWEWTGMRLVSLLFARCVRSLISQTVVGVAHVGHKGCDLRFRHGIDCT